MTYDPLAQFRQLATEASAYEFTVEEDSFDIDPELLEFDPVAGDKVIGVLNNTEQKLFRIMLSVEAQLKDQADQLNATLNLKIANAIMDGNGEFNQEAINRIALTGQQTTVNELFRLQSLYTKLHGIFWHLVRSRLQSFTTFIEIRAGFTVCVIGSKIA